MNARALKSERVQTRAQGVRFSVSATQLEAIGWRVWARQQGYRSVSAWLADLAFFEVDKLQGAAHVARVRAREATPWHA